MYHQVHISFIAASHAHLHAIRKSHVTSRLDSKRIQLGQVRYMVGALVKVGQGEWNEADIRRMLEVDPQRTPFPPANLLAPAHGLFLRGVDYGGADTAVARQ